MTHINKPAFRIGQGFDVHAFCDGDHVTLGGVKIPFERGLLAHSDGDVLLHALCDALLGALALGDIGKHFPPTDARWKDADSRDLLKQVARMVGDQDYAIGNVDLTLIGEQPRLSSYIDAIQKNIAEDLSIALNQVSIKATTTEGLGFTGRREGLAAQAIALLIAQ